VGFATIVGLATMVALGTACGGEEATGGVGGAGGAACSEVDGQPGTYYSCDCCQEEQSCETVQMVGTFYRCVTPVVPGPGEFACGSSTICLDGMICEIRWPVGDGSTQYSCKAPPSACAGDLTCACLLDAIPNATECSEDDGNFTVSGPAT
jgi:hypothetical protein